jgi:hypothetical protein
MRLHPDWKKILKHAYSVRLDVLGIVIGTLEVGYNAISGSSLLSPIHMACVGMGLTAASLTLRLVKQKKVSGSDEEAES